MSRDSRRRRTTAKAVNYAKEQDFSDVDDVFEDDANDDDDRPHNAPAGTGSVKKRGRPRKSTGIVEVEDDFGGPPKPVYTEKGYDPHVLPLRERFPFLPEYEADGSPRIELIVGRRPIVEKGKAVENLEEDPDLVDESAKEAKDGAGQRAARRRTSANVPAADNKKGKKDAATTKKGKKDAAAAAANDETVEYEYLIKYKGKSYLHLAYKTGHDLESMNKSAKTLYRRFLKKIAAGTEEGLEDPEFDASFAVPQKIVDEAEQEVTVELTDKELIEWEKEREKEMEDEDDDDDDDDDPKIEGADDVADEAKKEEEAKKAEEEKTAKKAELDLGDDLDFSNLPIDKLRKIANMDGPYYPVIEGSNNPYRDGFITEPPKKPRASYIFFQCSLRGYFQKLHPKAVQSELMTILGETWRNMSEEEQAPFLQLAQEEAQHHEKERALMEKAQRPNEVWQPMRRCLMVLDRLVKDGFANIFLEPVDLEDFPDYEELVDTPMDLGTIRTKLKTKKYQAPENFARDMRRVWNNCKVYNQHGSAIWFVADYMSKQFERLYSAWVQEFRDRFLRWAHPKARPWEHTCRKCDGKCGTPDDKMILCDHCDAMYGVACIKMKKIPKGVWHCPECKPKLKANKSIRLQSAMAEAAARRKAELGDIPKKKVMQKMYLVKWAGLGYEFCTWETKADINDDALIAAYHQLNNMTPDEPDLTEEEVNKVLNDVKHVSFEAAGGVQCVPDLRVQLYAQSRAFQFSKFGTDIPEPLAAIVGPKTKALIASSVPSSASAAAAVTDEDEDSTKVDDNSVNTEGEKVKVEEKDTKMETGTVKAVENGNEAPKDIKMAKEDSAVKEGTIKEDASKEDATKVKEDTAKEDKVTSMEVDSVKSSQTKTDELVQHRDVLECVHDLVHRVIRNNSQQLMKVNSNLPHLLTGEYDSIIPITSKGLMMNVGEIHGSVAFLGYRSFPDGSKGPAELNNIIRNVGDKIIAVDGVRTIDKTFKEVILMLRESGKNKYAFMRFLENRYAVCNSDLTSVGNTGRYTVEELQKKFSTDRKRLIVQRTQHVEEEEEVKEEDDEEEEEADPDEDANESESDGSEGEFEPDSDDEDLVRNRKKLEMQAAANAQAAGLEPGAPVLQGATAPATTGETNNDTAEKLEGENLQIDSAEDTELVPIEEPVKESMIVRQETTRSLAYRLLDVDIGYSSDEGGNEDCHYYVDGVDDTFTLEKEVAQKKEPTIDEVFKVEKEEAPKKKEEEKSGLPMKRNEFAALGDRGKVTAAITVTNREADPEDFINFPDPSPKELEAKRKMEEEAKQRGVELEAEALAQQQEASPSKAKRSTVKVEQIVVTTGEVVRVWANAETAAATLQVNLDNIKRMLKGKYDEDLGDEVGGYRWRYAAAGAEVTGAAAAGSSRGSKKGKEAYLEFRDKLYDAADPHIYKNGNRLRDYQVDGVNWLASTWYKKHSCILADEMGLGKTVQIVTYIEHIFRVEKFKRPFLVVVPLSTVEHWRREFQGWTDMVCCVYHDRQRVWRDVLREYEWYFEDRPHTSEFLKFDVLVTTYDTLIGDFDVIGQIPWRVAVVDEAHRLRNTKGKLLECMKEISARGTLQYGYQSRVLMTGTPLQNNTQELWTLLNFIEPYKFPSVEDFQMNFGNMANREQVEALQRKIAPYMLRRVKEDVAKDIPAKEETVIDVELTSIQKQYYRAIFEHNHAFLSMGPTRSTAPKLMNIQMELRKCCNHPFLLDGVEQREMERLYGEFFDKGKFEGKNGDEQQYLLNESGYVMTSGKMVLLDKLLPKLRAEGHKVLIFSQMVRMLDLISEYADFRGFRHERLDGRVRGNERQKAIDRFEREEDSFMFLLSTRAGGVGINLTAADTCIIFDSDWNPQNDVQAQARCHRIGQTKDVRIYRLVTSRTFEQEMFDRASKKLGLEQAVLGTFNNDNDDDKPTSKEMEQLLKKGAYALLDDDNDQTEEFCADDIDSILAKRTRTRVVEGAKTSSWLNKQGMAVSKSKFSTGGESGGVNVDDPDFWQKVMPDFVTPHIMLVKLNELSEMIEGTTTKPKGRGRGRGRWKKKDEEEKKEELAAAAAAGKDIAPGETSVASTEPSGDDKQADDKPVREPATEEKIEAAEGKSEIKEEEVVGGDANEKDADDDDDEQKEEEKKVLSRTNQRKVHKFMADLKSMMDGVLEEAEDDSLQSDDKQACTKLLLTISVKEAIFNEEERHLARSLMKRLEGDRRRRCRTSTDGPGSRLSNTRSNQQDNDKGGYGIPEDLLILSKQQRKKRRKTKDGVVVDGRRKRRSSGDDDDDDVDEDGYLRHSDDEGDWSDVGNDVYASGRKKRASISIKEAKRRRAWAHDDDDATAAGRPWPAFPRHLVKEVLGSLLDEVIEYDKSKGGMFSEPVPRDDYPEYYEQIKKPMDYGTMKEKLENGEYRSAQSMQKDFILIMQNCVKFNAADSDVVREARQQTLLRPASLKNAAKKHNLFLAEDGSVLEILDEKEKKVATNPDGTPKKKRKRRNKSEMEADEAKEKKVIKRRRKKKEVVEKDDDDTVSDEEEAPIANLKKPRIKISMNGGEKRKRGSGKTKTIKTKDGDNVDEENVSVPKKKRGRKSEGPTSEVPRKKKKKVESEVTEKDDVDEAETKPNTDVVPAVESKDASDTNDEDEPDAGESLPLYLNVQLWKKEREALDGTFKAARELYLKHGPWVLPEEVSDRFDAIAAATLTKMTKHDHYSVFAEAVTEEEAPDYYEVVSQPMDFSKMMEKLESGGYGSGSEAAATLYQDFMLVFENCALYNDEDGEVWEEATRVFGLLPETFAASCRSVLGKRKNIKDRLSKS